MSGTPKVHVLTTDLVTINGLSLLGKDNLEILNGKSAYELYVAGLGEGVTPLTEAEWITSLQGDLSPINSAIENINNSLENKVEKVDGKGLSTNDLTNELLDSINSKKVKNVAGDNINKTIKVTFTDDTETVIDLAELVTDIYVDSAEFDAVTNVITLNKANSNEKVTIDLAALVPNIDLTPLEEAISDIELSLETKITFTESAAAPVDPKSGDEWFDLSEGRLYKRVSDGTNSIWMDITSADAPIGQIKYHKGATAPTDPIEGDEWLNTTDDTLYKWMEKESILGWHEIGGGSPKGDLVMPDGASIILTSPDGTKYKVSIADGGRLTSTVVENNI